MSHEPRVRFESQISIGNVLSILTMLTVGLGAFFAVREGGAVLAQRVDKVERSIEKGEAKDEETSRAINDVRGAIIELRGDQKIIRMESERQGRQLDRIEQLLRTPQPQPKATP